MAEKRGHYVKEGRVFIQDEDGAFLELVPTADGNFDTKPAKKEDVRGASFVDAPFVPQQAAFAGQKLPGETPPPPAPPGPPMPPGYTLTAEEEQEVGASAEEAQREHDQALADAPLNIPMSPFADGPRGFEARHGFAQGSPEHERRIQEITEGRGDEEFEARRGFKRGSPEHEQYVRDIEASNPKHIYESGHEDWVPEEGATEEDTEEEATEEDTEEEATEEEADEAAEDLGLVVEEQADDNPELAQEVADPKLQGMDGRQRVVHVLQNRQSYPEFNRALRSAAEQFYTDRRSGRNMAIEKVFGNLPQAMAMKAHREMPQRLEQSELKEERERLIAAQETATKFNIELKQGQYSSAASLLGSLLDTATQRQGQVEGLEQRRGELSSSQRHTVLLQDLNNDGIAVKDARDASAAAGAEGLYGSYGWGAEELSEARNIIAKTLQKNPSGLGSGNAGDRAKLAGLQVALAHASGTPGDPYAQHAFITRVGHMTQVDQALSAMSSSLDDMSTLGPEIKAMAYPEMVRLLTDEYGYPLEEAEATAEAREGFAYPWDAEGAPGAAAQAKADALAREAIADGNYTDSLHTARTQIGMGLPAGKQKEAVENTLAMLGSDDPDKTLVEVARLATLGDAEGKGGLFEGAPLFDPDSYTADLEKVEADLAGARLSPMQRQIENLKSTEQGASAMAALTGRGLSEAEAVERLVKTVGKRSFKQDARKIGGAMRREHRGRAREGDESLLMAGPSEVEEERSMTAGRPFSLTGDTGAPLAEEEDEDSGRAPTQPVAQYEAPDLGVQETLGTKKAPASYAEAGKKERRNVIMEQMFPSSSATLDA